MLHAHLLIISTSAESQCFAAVAILNMYIDHDLNGLDAYTLHTVHEQDLTVVRHEGTNYTIANVHVLYSKLRDTYKHCSHATCKYLVKFLE